MRRPNPRASTLLELADALSEQQRQGADRATSAWTVHITYARRTAMALAGNDLALALRSAEIAGEAQAIFTAAEASEDPDVRAANIARYEVRAAEYRESQRAARAERSLRRRLVTGD